jgi:Immunity protein Imm1
MKGKVDRPGYDEIWVNHKNGSSMCALIHGDLGCLLYMKEPGDGGFSSRNTEYDGDPDATLDYYLTNGQRDEHPLAWAIPAAKVREALIEFRRTGKRSAVIHWQADSD